MATSYTKEWIRFFTGCGIPDDVATMYALIFYENRIQKNMLPDLNKEYLRDMGITVMGDVIAILRYAKVMHEKYIREQILSVDNNISIDSNNLTNDTSPSNKKSTPMKRILEHYTRKYNYSDLDTLNEVQVILPNDKVTSVTKKITETAGKQTPLKKKIEISLKQTNLNEKKLEVPVPKVRRVLPENEGGYKIKMPLGTTEKSKKLLEQAKKRKIKTVFDRLGESSVSSTTSEISAATSSSSISSLKNSSVFSRLGEKTSAVSSTSSADDVDGLALDQLPYAGILKGNSQKKNLPSTTMRADEQQKSEMSKLNSKKGISVKKRLGLTKQNLVTQSTKSDAIKTARSENLQKGGGIKKSKILKLSNKLNSPSGGKTNSKVINLSNESYKSYGSESRQGNSIVQNNGVRGLKRKLENSSSDASSPSKKVRFGKTTHRLIPSTPSPSDPVSYVKNYPKLTMIINNRGTPVGKVKLSSGIETGSLNSDKIRQKVGIKERIGNKSIQGRLGKRVEPPGKKITRIQDRLG